MCSGGARIVCSSSWKFPTGRCIPAACKGKSTTKFENEYPAANGQHQIWQGIGTSVGMGIGDASGSTSGPRQCCRIIAGDASGSTSGPRQCCRIIAGSRGLRRSSTASAGSHRRGTPGRTGKFASHWKCKGLPQRRLARRQGRQGDCFGLCGQKRHPPIFPGWPCSQTPSPPLQQLQAPLQPGSGRGALQPRLTSWWLAAHECTGRGYLSAQALSA